MSQTEDTPKPWPSSEMHLRQFIRHCAEQVESNQSTSNSLIRQACTFENFRRESILVTRKIFDSLIDPCRIQNRSHPAILDFRRLMASGESRKRRRWFCSKRHPDHLSKIKDDHVLRLFLLSGSRLRDSPNRLEKCTLKRVLNWTVHLTFFGQGLLISEDRLSVFPAGKINYSNFRYRSPSCSLSFQMYRIDDYRLYVIICTVFLVVSKLKSVHKHDHFKKRIKKSPKIMQIFSSITK